MGDEIVQKKLPGWLDFSDKIAQLFDKKESLVPTQKYFSAHYAHSSLSPRERLVALLQSTASAFPTVSLFAGGGAIGISVQFGGPERLKYRDLKILPELEKLIDRQERIWRRQHPKVK